MLTEDGSSYHHTRGLPMGSPLTSLVALIYLNDFDWRLSQIKGGFYARYGDDILIAHPDYATARSLEAQLRHELTHLGLHINTSKDQLLYLTRSGSPHRKYLSLKSSQKVSYLGLDIYADGAIGLATEAQQLLLKDLRERLNNLVTLYADESLAKKGPLICEALRQCYKRYNPLANEQVCRLLAAMTHRPQLKQIDYLIALTLSQLLSGVRGVKSFRHISYKTIRETWNLPSIYQLRNRYGRQWKPSATG